MAKDDPGVTGDEGSAAGEIGTPDGAPVGPGPLQPGTPAPADPWMDSGNRARKASRREAKRAAKADRKAAKALAKAERKAAKAAKRAAKAAFKAAGKAPSPSRTANAASAVLREAAELVRQAAAPATARIVQRVTERMEPEGVPESESEPPSEPFEEAPSAPDSEPEPEPAAEPERQPAPGSDSVPEPEPEPVAAPVALSAPEPEREPAPGSVPAPGTALVAAEPSAVVAIQATGEIVVGASVDVGANSVHLLIAAVGGHRLEPLVDESVFLGLGDRVESAGYLGPALRGELVAALVRYTDAARRLGAREITLVGTEPMRRAADAAAIVHEVERSAGVPLHVLGHEEEGVLTLLGVTRGNRVTQELVVVDIGGGSSEVVSVGPGRAPVAVGVPVGSARLTQRFSRVDPPSQAEVMEMAAEARRLVVGAPPAQPAELVAVGGTSSNLLRVLPGAALERVLTRRRITIALATLATEPSEMAAARHAVHAVRARILPAGGVIVQAFLEHYAIDRLRVSEDGLREGAIHVAAVAGHSWRDRLNQLALGWD